MFFLCLFCLFSCGNYFFFLMRADFHFFADGCHTPYLRSSLISVGSVAARFGFSGVVRFGFWAWIGFFWAVISFFCACPAFFRAEVIFSYFKCPMRAKSHVFPISIATPYIRFPGCVSSEYPLMYPCFLYPSSIFVTVACTFPIFRFQLDSVGFGVVRFGIAGFWAWIGFFWAVISFFCACPAFFRAEVIFSYFKCPMRAKSHVFPISIATPYIRFPGCVSSEYPLMYPCFLYPSSIFVTVACTFPIFRFQLDVEA